MAWLLEIGAVRPMSIVSDEVLVLGTWYRGRYPIMWSE